MAEETKKSKAFPWLIGCGIAFVAVGVLCAGGAWFGFGFVKKKVIDLAHTELTDMVEESGLPAEQVASMRADLDRLRQAAVDGNVDFDSLGTLDQEFERVISLGVVQYYAVSVVPASGMPAEEQADAVRTLERFARGIQEKTLSSSGVRNLRFDFEPRGDAEQGREIDIEEVRLDVQRIREIVDTADIPDEPYQVDVAMQFSSLVDGLIGN